MGIANGAAFLAAGIAIGLGAIGSGIGLGYAAGGAARSMAKQPYFKSTLFRNMLVGQVITETPVIFSLVVAFLLFFSASENMDAPNSPTQTMVLLSAGLCIGIGAIGSGAGSGLIANEAILATARCPSAQGNVFMFMLIGQAWVQTGVIFALVISLFLLNIGGFAELSTPGDYHLMGLIPISAGEVTSVGRYLGAGLGMGFGAIGSSIGISTVAGKACEAMALSPDSTDKVKNIFFVGSATAQSPTIFALIISLLLLIKT